MKMQHGYIQVVALVRFGLSYYAVLDGETVIATHMSRYHAEQHAARIVNKRKAA